MTSPKGRVRNQIRDLRTARGLSQGVLADMVGATRQTINAIEQEKYAPSLELAFRIARAFEKPFEDVWQFGDTDPPHAA
jgi:putative transcriptional regulator